MEENLVVDDIKYFLKFGKRKNISSIKNNQLWFSTPETLRPLEDSLVRGQGDKHEGGMRLITKNFLFTEEETGKQFRVSGPTVNIDFLIEPVNKVPLYCLFACYEKDCDTNGKIVLSKEIQQTIREHFPEADAVVIVPNPEEFVKKITNTISCNGKEDIRCISESVGYYHVFGFNERALDLSMFEYLTQDSPVRQTEKGWERTALQKYAWRILFCKDVFFQNEQEYRFILPDEIVENGKLYEADIDGDSIEIMDLDEFFKQ